MPLLCNIYQREAYSATCTSGTCIYDNTSLTEISASGSGVTAESTAQELTITQTSGTGSLIYAESGGTVNIKGSTVITSSSSGNAAVFSTNSGSNINFSNDLNITSSGLIIQTNDYGTVTINGDLFAKNTGTILRTIYSQANSKITINGNVEAFGATAVNASVINAEGANSEITITGHVKATGGNGDNSSVVYANGGGILKIGSVEIIDNATTTNQAGILALNGSELTIQGKSSVSMKSGAALQAISNSHIKTGDLIIDIRTADNNETLALWAENTSTITVGAVEITMTGTDDYGFSSKNNSTITANGSVYINLSGGTTTSTSGNTSAGIFANNSNVITNSGARIITNGAGSDGVRLAEYGKFTNTGELNIDIQGTAVQRTAGKCGTGSAICVVGNNGALISTGGGTIKSTGHAIHMESGTKQSIDLSGVNISTTSTGHAVIEVQNSNNGSSIKLTNSTATAGDNGNGLLINAGSGSVLDFEAINTQLYGEIKADNTSTVNLSLKNSSYLKGIIDPINLNISTDSRWDVTGDSELDQLLNAGSINFISSSSNTSQRLKVNSYSGDGNLGLNTYLNAGVGSSDILEILAGGTASGNNYINILNKDGLGVLPPEIGLQVVQAPVGATQLDTFALPGGSVAAGIYEYTLYQNTNGNWYLSAHQTNNGKPSYNGSVSSVVSFASLAQLYNNLSLGTWNERVGDMAYADIQQIQAIQQKASPLWVRIEHERGEHDGGKQFQATSTTDMYSPQFKYRTSFIQVGADLLRQPMAQGAYQFAGVSFTAGTIHADVDHFSGSNGNRRTRAGTAKINNYSLGGYWTYLAADRSYVDIVGQYTRHSLDGYGPAGSVNGNGHTLAASVEAGKTFVLSNPSWILVPQAQLRYQDVKLKHIAAKATTSVVGNYHFGDNDSLDLRLGLEARYQFTQQKANASKQGAWVRFDVLHEFKGKNTVQYTPVNGGEQPIFTSTRRGTSVNLEGGLAIPVSDTASIYSAAGYRRGLGSNKGHGWKAEVGMRWVY